MAQNPQSVAGATILVVDDEDVIRSLMCDVLEDGGYRVLSAANGRKAVAMFAEQGASIDLILLDMQMPELDGRQTLALIRASSTTVPVVMATGYHSQETLRQLRSEGVSAILSKPFHIEELLTTVSSVLPPRT